MQERIIANSVVAPDGPFIHGEFCWLWLGKTRTSNRGNKVPALTKRLTRGPRRGQVVNVTVARLVLMEFKNRRMTPRMVARHLCDNSICVNPAHLIGGTQKQNVRDAVERGRHRNGATGPLKEAA